MQGYTELQVEEAKEVNRKEMKEEWIGITSDCSAKGAVRSGAHIKLILRSGYSYLDKLTDTLYQTEEKALLGLDSIPDNYFVALNEEIQKCVRSEYDLLQSMVIEYFNRMKFYFEDTILLEVGKEWESKPESIMRRTKLLEKEIQLKQNQLGKVSDDVVKVTEEQDADTKISTDKRKVFVVHGRNEKARIAMFTFLSSLDLHPIEWPEAIKNTGKGSPYIGEVLHRAFDTAQAFIVFITGDDIVKLSQVFSDSSDESEFTLQARPNVLFEAGMAIGRHPDRTIFVQLGDGSSIFSDIAGRHLIKISDAPEARKDLVERLKTAKCKVNDSGKGWLSIGDFDLAFSEYAKSINAELSSLSQITSKQEDLSLSENEVDILKLIANDANAKVFTLSEICTSSEMSVVEVRYNLDKLVKSNCLRSDSSRGELYYQTKSKGRAYLVENNLV